MIGRWKGPVATTTFAASIAPAEVSARKPLPSALLRSAVTSTPQRMGALIRSAWATKYSTISAAEGKPSGSLSENSRLGNLSCQAGPLATRESHLSERHRSAIRCRSTMRCGSSCLVRCSLIASPAWPPPMMSVLTFSTDMVGVLFRFSRLGKAPRSLACASGLIKYNYLRIEIGKIDPLRSCEPAKRDRFTTRLGEKTRLRLSNWPSVLSSRLVGHAAADEAARQRAGVLVVAQQHLAVSPPSRARRRRFA